MPEGDTLYRAARTLHRALAGHAVVRFESVLPALTRIHEDQPITGRTIERVAAAGKHLLMQFSGGLVLRTHMRMNGSWHIYRPGERWRRPRRDMRLLVATAHFEAVGFNVPIAEFLTPRTLKRQEDLRLMGPDLLAEAFDDEEALHRLRDHPSLSIADALINQRIVAGAGNVYKSEVLFLCRLYPFTAVSAVPAEELQKVLATARRLLRANAVDRAGPRRTTGRSDPSQRLYVYGRARLPCRMCGTRIRAAATGTHARLTYWCPHCQRHAQDAAPQA